MKNKIIIIMSIFSSIFGMTAQQLYQVKVLEPNDYKNAISIKKVQLFDVRTSQEYNSGHIKNAINVDVFNKNSFVAHFKTLDTETPVYLYCRSGSRSQKAAKLLVELGFKEIYDLKGGFLNWKN